MEEIYLGIAISAFVLAACSLVACVVIFFKLKVLDAIRFLQHKPVGNSSAEPRLHVGFRSRKKPVRAGADSTLSGAAAESRRDSEGQRVGSLGSASPCDSEGPTDVLGFEDSERPTGLLAEDEARSGDEESERPTGLLCDDSDDESLEGPTRLLDDGSENPTDCLDDESERPTGLLDDSAASDVSAADSSESDSEGETKLLCDEGSECSTEVLGLEDSESPTDFFGSDECQEADGQEADEEPSSFRFVIKQSIVGVHTDEAID